MFRTYQRDAMLLTSKLEPGLHLWPRVEQIILLPWFYVTAVRPGDPCSRHMLMVSDVQTLEDLGLAGPDVVQIESILLAIPPAMNGENRWLMEPLLEIAYVPKSKSSARHYRFRVGEKAEYASFTDIGLEIEQGNVGRIVFSTF